MPPKSAGKDAGKKKEPVEVPPDEPPDEDADEWDLNEREILLAKLKLRLDGAIATEGHLRVLHDKVRSNRVVPAEKSPQVHILDYRPLTRPWTASRSSSPTSAARRSTSTISPTSSAKSSRTGRVRPFSSSHPSTSLTGPFAPCVSRPPTPSDTPVIRGHLLVLCILLQVISTELLQSHINELEEELSERAADFGAGWGKDRTRSPPAAACATSFSSPLAQSAF